MILFSCILSLCPLQYYVLLWPLPSLVDRASYLHASCHNVLLDCFVFFLLWLLIHLLALLSAYLP